MKDEHRQGSQTSFPRNLGGSDQLTRFDRNQPDRLTNFWKLVRRPRGKLYVLSVFRRAKHAVPEGRLKNRPALQRRLLTIQIGPAPGGLG